MILLHNIITDLLSNSFSNCSLLALRKQLIFGFDFINYYQNLLNSFYDFLIFARELFGNIYLYYHMHEDF